MLDLPFMQPVQPSARVPASTEKGAVDSRRGEDASAGFQAEYEEASAGEENTAKTSDNEVTTAQEMLTEGEDNRTGQSESSETEMASISGAEEKLGLMADAAPVAALEDQKTPTGKGAPAGQEKPEGADLTAAVAKPAKTEAEQIKTHEKAGGVGATQDTPRSVQPKQSSHAPGVTAENIVLTKAVETAGIKPALGESFAAKGGQQQITENQAPTLVPRPQGATDRPPVAATVEKAIALPEVAEENRRSVRASDRLSEVATTEPPKPPPIKPTAQPVPASIAIQAVQAKVTTAKDKAEGLLTPMNDLDVVTAFEPRTHAQPVQSNLAQAASRADTPAHIARQMAEALQRLPDRPVEISLNPKELGRVRMSISAAEAGIVVNVIAERPETLDLMRRNIEQLSREFEMIGYSDIGFAFAEGKAQQGFSQDENENSDQSYTYVKLDTPEAAEPPDIPVVAAATGIDIRL